LVATAAFAGALASAAKAPVAKAAHAALVSSKTSPFFMTAILPLTLLMYAGIARLDNGR
jgi:hypothetical protein